MNVHRRSSQEERNASFGERGHESVTSGIVSLAGCSRVVFDSCGALLLRGDI
jgi:hypothetical protein